MDKIEQKRLDLFIFGEYFEMNGKRIDPQDIYLDEKEMFVLKRRLKMKDINKYFTAFRKDSTIRIVRNDLLDLYEPQTREMKLIGVIDMGLYMNDNVLVIGGKDES